MINEVADLNLFLCYFLDQLQTKPVDESWVNYVFHLFKLDGCSLLVEMNVTIQASCTQEALSYWHVPTLQRASGISVCAWVLDPYSGTILPPSGSESSFSNSGLWCNNTLWTQPIWSHHRFSKRSGPTIIYFLSLSIMTSTDMDFKTFYHQYHHQSLSSSKSCSNYVISKSVNFKKTKEF